MTAAATPASLVAGSPGPETVVPPQGRRQAVPRCKSSRPPLARSRWNPNQEKVVCITLRLPNADPAYVARITAQLLKGHHLVTYRSSATAENLTPTSCTTFQGILSGTGQPLMITEKPADDLTFPQGVALKIAAQQMIQLEGHYINPGTSAVQGTGR